ncbi:uncharacterized protein MYCFIDRAFT_161165 [Pseudocercospora fijiensis CIRAD86]|uniref:Uncharacterized protein n=1 Tax=Pseudocercospora fijiensis (strain CIRAD86) TaxID=383855 RepID=M2Z6T3_PSEFD|nr:uncharacterized protein MYCFIDRAFT_161165 [Pseudocercospora fijiensis CIRAD86]EME85490.1 hypothetical protein MYCFIDRAFT_161165 [Pseudocercospora fijiensis CIRAD86]
MPKPSGIEGFRPLSDSISVYRPEGATAPGRTPTLIVICSWMAAAPKHIAKYTAGYQKLFPFATILLIQSSMIDMTASDAKMVKRLEMARHVIEFDAFDADGDKSGIIHLHAFSNGGGTVATHLALSLWNSRDRKPTRIWNKVVFECLPGRPRAEQAVTAISYSLPSNWLVRIVGRFLIRVYIYSGLFLCWLLRREDMLTRERRRLNAIPSNTSGPVPRLYMYSKADPIVSAIDCHDHAVEARKIGFKEVHEEVFEKAPHCGLPREDPERYWGIISDWMANAAQ